MNKTVFFYDLQTGVFSGQSLGGPAQWVDSSVPAGVGAWSGSVDPLSQRVDLSSGALVDFQPGKPTDTELITWHWDEATRRWVEKKTIAWFRSAKKSQVSAVREQKNSAPIQYAGTLFDADELGQRNIQACVSMLNAGGTLPADFVWRDFYNVNHAANAAFVIGLCAAIVDRGTHLYQVSWQKKAQIDLLTTEQAIIAYDEQAGW